MANKPTGLRTNDGAAWGFEKSSGTGTAADPYIPEVSLGAAADATALLGVVGSPDISVNVTPTLSTSAYTSGDILFVPTEIANAARASGGLTLLQSIVVIDKDDEGKAFDLLFFNQSTTFAGSVNDAYNEADSIIANCVGAISVAASDYVDTVNNQVATLCSVGLAMSPSSTSLYVAAIARDTPTFASASDLVIRFNFLRS